MKPLLAGELVKLRTTRTFYALIGAAIATSILITALISLLSESSAEDVLVNVFTSDTSTLFILILAIVGISGEWRHRTITGSLLVAPNRLRFLTAKLIAFAIAGLALSLLVSLAITVLGYAILSARDLPVPELGELAGQVARNAFVAALFGAFGIGIGAVVRNQAVAIVAVLLISLGFDPVLAGLLPELAPYTPFTGLPAAIQEIPAASLGFDRVEFLAAIPATLAMLAWIGAFFAAGYLLLRARDLE